jgi:hypothetical protein
MAAAPPTAIVSASMEAGKAHWVDNAKLFAAERMARAYVSGVSLCEEAGRPLTGLQQTELMKAALLELEGIEEAVSFPL